MTFKKCVKAFVAGLLFPAVFMPIAYTVLYVLELHTMPTHNLQFIPMYIPLLFGLTNILYVRRNDGTASQNANVNLWVTGGTLGFIVAVFGVYVLSIPAMVFGIKGGFEFMPLIILPIIYGAVFRYIVKWLNKTIAV